MNNRTSENNLSSDDYVNAMNMIGQALYGALAQTMQKLEPALQNNEIVIQGLAAFFSNIVHQQAPRDQDLRQQMLEHFTSVVQAQLDHFIEHPAN